MAVSGSSAFIGRAAELARLVAALEDTRGALPAFVVSGEAGAGKTRLLREFCRRAQRRGATVLSGRCLDGAAGPPYRPVAEALRPLGAGATGDRCPGEGVPGGWFERVLASLEAAGASGPAALLLDDLHWADGSTRDLLGFLLANLTGGPGPVVVVTVRPEALVPGHPLVGFLAELRRSRRAEFLDLGPLPRCDVAAQVASILGQEPEPALVDDIWARSEGNPFFVEELLRAARDGHEQSSTLQAVLDARLAALSPDARTVAEAVAVAAGPVPHRILAGVADLTEARLLAALRECVDHHVLVADRRGGTYAFRHGLLREAASARMLPGEAIRRHGAYARALGAGGGPVSGGDLAAVAWHWYAAGDAERGLPAALAAALTAEAASGHAEAHLHYERALELSARLPPRRLERAFAVATALAFVATAGPPSPAAPGRAPGAPSGGGRCFDRMALAERAAEAARNAGEPLRAATLLEEARRGARPADLARLHRALGRARWAAGDSRGALAAYDEAIRCVADPETGEAVRTLTSAAEARMLAGRFRESKRLAEEALGIARRLGLVLEEAEALGTLGVDLAFLGDAAAAGAALDEAVATAEKAGLPRPLARAWINRAEVLSGPLNRLAEAAEVAAAGVVRLRHLGLARSDAAVLAAVEANTLFRSGRWRDARAVLEAALADRPTGAAAIELLLARARLAVGTGEFACAHADLDRIDRSWTQADVPRYRAPLITLVAGLALWEGRTEAARAAVARALELVSGSDDVWLVAPVLWHGIRAEGDRAEQARATGDRSQITAAGREAATFLARAERLAPAAAPAVVPVVAAYGSLWRAEATRIAATADPDAWSEAAGRWATLGQPYPAAYARFREAEALLAGRTRPLQATRSLRAAHEVASALGAEPFRRLVEALAARARIPLSAPCRGPGSKVGIEAGAPGPGPLATLSRREHDVLALLAEGRTNREVADALFISAKTASTHVSHILAKLGVRNRVQAAALAQRATRVPGNPST